MPNIQCLDTILSYILSSNLGGSNERVNLSFHIGPVEGLQDFQLNIIQSEHLKDLMLLIINPYCMPVTLHIFLFNILLMSINKLSK